MQGLTHTQHEVELLRPVVARMKFVGYEVFQEVQFEGMRIDLVATTDDDLIAIHGKKNLTDKLIEQARLTQGVSDYTVLAVPGPARASLAWAERLHTVEDMGLGLTLITDKREVKELIKPSPNHHAQPDRLRAALRNEQQDFAPAGSKSEMWTPEREWLKAIESELNTYGEIRVMETDSLQANSPDRVKRGAVPNAINRLYRDGKLPFARIENRGGQSWIVRNE